MANIRFHGPYPPSHIDFYNRGPHLKWHILSKKTHYNISMHGSILHFIMNQMTQTHAEVQMHDE